MADTTKAAKAGRAGTARTDTERPDTGPAALKVRAALERAGGRGRSIIRRGLASDAG
jgi:hypothetical protein